mgnify:CR=1 FL=1|jgi:hypothetical protein|tara:strand:+ start:2296 stop:3207 length:912 start_codon:yes stop_codon:yes gene_type:complete
MSDITLFDSMPDEYKELLAQLEPETVANTSSNTIRRISIRGGVFRKVVGGQEIAELEERSLSFIIVKAAPISRTYYAGQYVAGQTNPPTCWSGDTNTGRPGEDVGASDKQSNTCFDCPQNIKGSGMGESRACRYQQRVAILLADQDGTVRSNEVYQLILPATSVFGDDKKKMGLQTYARFLNSQTAPLASVITEIRFDTDSSTPKLLFKPLRPVTQDELKITLDLQKDPEVLKLVTMSVKPKQDTSAPQLTSDKVAPPSAIREENITEEEPEKIEEPTVKKSNKKAEPTPQVDLASLLDEFDD